MTAPAFKQVPCEGCGTLTPPQTWGQPRKWCSDECRTATRNARRRRGPADRSPVTRLRRKLVVTDSGCHEFNGCRNEHGYGAMRGGDGRTVLAHRLAWELANGPVPEDMCVCHRCDNPPCCNLDHLFLGTHADNMRDRDAKGRTLRGAALRKARWGR